MTIIDHVCVNAPKLHHYVPQFYLRRFADAAGRLWVWDRDRDRQFSTKPGSVAAGTNFYYISDFVEQDHDPLTMERQFSDIEGEVSAITGQWIEWIRQGEPGEAIEVPEVNREIVSLFLALQFFRTADARSALAAFAVESGYPVESEDEERALHVELLWESGLVQSLADRLKGCSWVFGRNETEMPFVTSDNPIAFRLQDNSMWVKAGIFVEGAYATYPLSPDIIMYCYPNEGLWKEAKIEIFDCRISPVKFHAAMIQGDNSGQVFMASRFVMSNKATFDTEREFAKTIGTNAFREYWASLNSDDQAGGGVDHKLE